MSLDDIYSLILFISGTIALVVVVAAWPRRKSKIGSTLVIMMIATVVWTWTYALYWQYPEWPRHFFWLDTTYIGVVTIPVFVFVFAVQLANPNINFNRTRIILLSAIPLLTLLILWTDPYHHFFFGGRRSPTASDIYIGGPWFWANVIYSYGLLTAAFLFLLSSLINSRGKIYQVQYLLCILGLSFPMIISVMGVMGIHPLPGLDLVPIMFIVTGIFFIVSLRIFHLGDLVPIAQNVLLDQMVDGMLVVDMQYRIVESNEVASTFLKAPKTALIGKSLEQANRLFEKLFQVKGFGLTSNNRVLTTSDGLTLDIQINPLFSGKNQRIGYAIIWRDISRQKKIEDDLWRANLTLTKQLEQIESLQKKLMEQVIRDPLTNLFNRRFLENVLPKEIARNERANRPLGFLVLDIDYFKRINDQYGHDVGDRVLVEIAAKLEEITRAGDWLMRYGGEEFFLVLVDTDLRNAVLKAEEVRAEIEKMEIRHLGITIRVTVSIGIAEFPKHGKDWLTVFKAADEAMYQAKHTGRNRSCTFNG